MRVSTAEQGLTRQLDTLVADVNTEDHTYGHTLDRTGRTGLLNMVQELKERGVGIRTFDSTNL